MIRGDETPSACAACTNSCSRSAMNLARTSRQGTGQLSRPITSIVLPTPGPAMAATVRMMITGGKVMITSVKRMITVSTHFPKNPAKA